MPESWLLHEQAETNAANLELDLVLMDQLDDQSFEVEGLTPKRMGSFRWFGGVVE